MGSWQDILGVVGSFVGILTAVPVFWLWHDHLWGRRKRHQLWFKQATTSTGKLRAILIIDLIAHADIAAQVRHFMAGDEELKSVSDENIIIVSREKDLKPNDIPPLVHEIKNKIGDVSRRGTDELSVFFAGPVTIAAIVGAELSNKCKVLLYQKDRDGNYVNFGPLRHPNL